MPSRILYKSLTKTIHCLTSLQSQMKLKFQSQASNIGPKLDGFVCDTFNGRKVYSPSASCLTLKRQIIENEIYGFDSELDEPYIVDCGANIGLGILYWKMKFPHARIVAFEPSKLVFEALQRNVIEHSLEGVTLVNAAVSSQDGFSDFTGDEEVSGSLFLEKNLEERYPVRTTKLDRYLKDRVSFLKVDIEGEEINVFPQILKYIDRIDNLFLEYHSFQKMPQTLSTILHALESNGFRYYIEGEYRNRAPLLDDHVVKNQDLQVGIWAKRIV